MPARVMIVGAEGDKKTEKGSSEQETERVREALNSESERICACVFVSV